ncbi:hypothetical protein WDC_1522 [Paucilactobacillus wasatchensis]|uniref:Uncharacterized protein n=1 Tax=Paucilactobacillus wasatchensis TaxID=1335616 RepID=A0A0D1A815_9LACO|nr:hypothetical protein WDC_1522 [Paucilactobacillus wasatchensis]
MPEMSDFIATTSLYYLNKKTPYQTTPDGIIDRTGNTVLPPNFI